MTSSALDQEAGAASFSFRRVAEGSLTAAVFFCSWLLFSLEPLSSKLLLPRLGGTPTVWITCLLFFQAALLIGYGYAYLSIRLLGLKRQAVLHVAVIAVSFAFIPVSLASVTSPPADAQPVVWLLGVLTSSIGLPFIVLSSFGPIAQRWFADADGTTQRDPYFLYAASNLGSLLALLAYPLLMEPLLTLSEQTRAWSVLYGGVLLGVAFIAVTISRRTGTVQAVIAAEPAVTTVTTRDRLRWLAYSAVPSSLLMGSTSYISTDIGSFPLLWVIPLALYLLTFTLVFARRQLLSHALMLKAEPQLIVVVALTIFWAISLPGVFSVVLHLLLLFLVAMVCHGHLARTRPPARHLTEFYLWLAAGGLAGGIFNAVIAPLAFNDVVEYPIAIVAAALLRPRQKRNGAMGDIAALLAFGVALILATWRSGSPPQLVPMISMVVFGVGLFSFRDRPRRFSIALAVLFAVGMARQASSLSGNNLLGRERSFFGVYHILEDSEGKSRMLEHGSTLHGAQALRPDLRLTPLSYYNPAGPAGDVFNSSLPSELPSRRVAVVGLGVGSLSCFGRPGEDWTYYEIDPLVARIASDTSRFTLLRDCPAKVKVVFGDARLTLAREKDASYDILVIDAFSSDAIPIHLLTTEAFREYMRVLDEDGVLAVHISNQHMNLEPLVGAIAAEVGIASLIRYDMFDGRKAESPVDRSPSVWVALARKKESFGDIGTNASWQHLRGSRRVKAWTDDYSNILSVIHWK